MKNYYFTLAGLCVELRVPYEIDISENLQPFLCLKPRETDCVILLRPDAQLSAFSGEGVWHGLEYYDRHLNESRIFYCKSPHSEAFAVTRFFENGNIEINVLPDCLSYFSGTTGIFNRIGMESLLLQHFGLLLHASLIKYEDKTLAFAGPSGVGKSTQANIWQKFLGADIINGDRAVLRKNKGVWCAYGSPYAGTSGVYKNDSAPLEAIVLLEQAEENRLRRLNEAEAFSRIYQEFSVHHWQKDFVARATDLCLQLLSETPIYLLECRPDEGAAKLLKKGLCL